MVKSVGFVIDALHCGLMHPPCSQSVCIGIVSTRLRHNYARFDVMNGFECVLRSHYQSRIRGGAGMGFRSLWDADGCQQGAIRGLAGENE